MSAWCSHLNYIENCDVSPHCCYYPFDVLLHVSFRTCFIVEIGLFVECSLRNYKQHSAHNMVRVLCSESHWTYIPKNTRNCIEHDSLFYSQIFSRILFNNVFKQAIWFLLKFAVESDTQKSLVFDWFSYMYVRYLFIVLFKLWRFWGGSSPESESSCPQLQNFFKEIVWAAGSKIKD